MFLRRAGIEVLLLEAGSERSALGLTLRIRGLTVAKSRGALRQRANVTRTADPDAMLFEELSPGGLSNHWSCAVPRFSEEDFADAVRAGEESTWPIGYQESRALVRTRRTIAARGRHAARGCAFARR